MDLRQMQYVLAIEKNGSMTNAAAHINVSQSAMSLSLKKLEEELGVALFQKDGRGITLTEAGKTFCKLADDILLRSDNLRAAMEEYKADRQNSVFIASDAFDFSNEAVLLYNAFFPDVHFNQRVCQANQVPHLLRSGRMDVAMTLSDMTNGEFLSRPVLEEPLYAVVRKDSAFGRRSRCSMKELADYPLVTLLDIFALRTLHDSFYQILDLRPAGVIEVGDAQSMLPSVARGQGVSFLPESTFHFMVTVLRNFEPGLTAIPVNDSICRRAVYVTTRKGLKQPPVLEGFIDFLSEFGKFTKDESCFPLPGDFVASGEWALTLR